jgi:hypothetical protein
MAYSRVLQEPSAVVAVRDATVRLFSCGQMSTPQAHLATVQVYLQQYSSVRKGKTTPGSIDVSRQEEDLFNINSCGASLLHHGASIQEHSAIIQEHSASILALVQLYLQRHNSSQGEHKATPGSIT